MTSQAKANGGFGKLLTGLVIGLVIGLIAGVFLGPILDSRSNIDFDSSKSSSGKGAVPPSDSREDRTPAQPPVAPQPTEPEVPTDEPTEG
ncbi:MAG: hypothetical protein KF768_07195 [Phycisphaeraceae bacterium]|nr:hypothetical protein [Phycisphaeraceae bacterium]